MSELFVILGVIGGLGIVGYMLLLCKELVSSADLNFYQTKN